MAATPQTGFLVLADLTGYTAYLSGSEIEHAPAIAGDLLETIVGRLEPPFRLVKFEGDAAFLFVEDGRAEGSLLLDAIEAAYLAFRRRLRSIDQATTCDCNSCRLAPRLDLKLFVHHGAFVWSRIAGRDELAGSDVIVAHRLLKGVGAAESRAQGFALFTGAAVHALGLDPDALHLRPSAEDIEHLGRIETFTLDLEARWQDESTARRVVIADTDVAFDIEATFAADPSVIWAHLTSPALRTRWEGPIAIEEAPSGGRRGIGTTTQCVTGRLATLEEIVDWQPYERVAWRLAVPGLGPVAATADLDPTDIGTRLRLRWGYLGGLPADPGAVGSLRVEGGRRCASCQRHRRRTAGRRAEGGREVIPFRSEQTIDRSAMDVWEYAADIDRHPTWMSVLDARIVHGRSTEVGARAHENVKIGPRRQTVEFEVAEADPGRRLAYRVLSGPMRGDVAMDLEAIAPERTRVVWAGSLGLTGFMRLVEPLFAGEIRAGEAAELVRLKERLEAAASATTAMS